ncbi:MAG: two-component sensor histidine kinase [Cyclobacteriaceae bacterium]|nr:two-component sensor histidine kinase [Cyclobacteriaceae bacterium]
MKRLLLLILLFLPVFSHAAEESITVCSANSCGLQPNLAMAQVQSGTLNLFSDLFSTSLWPARWHCGTWTPLHGWTYIISDLIIWLSYFAIPGILVFFYLRKGRSEGVPFHKIFLLFVGFILACGLTHLIDAAIFWWPAYKLSALLRLATAGISLFTVFALIKVIPDVLMLKTPAHFEKLVQERTRDLQLLNEQLQREINEKKKKDETLFQTNQELLAFSYSVSHDLRTPLRSIHGFSRALLEDYSDKLDESGQDFLNRIARASSRMGELIDDLLKLSRISRNELVVEDVNLSGMVEEVVATNINQKPGMRASFDIQNHIMVEADRKLLKIAIENLIDNAIKYSSKNPSPVIQFGKLPHREVFFVSDNGAGFDMKFKDKLFGAFQRLHEGEFEGSGIGLATVKRIVSRHGGEIWAESVEGKGATFYFTLK